MAMTTAWGQVNPAIRDTFVEGFGDVGKIKVQAEQGDVNAQIKLADAYLTHFKSADALRWYKAAAKQKSVEGEYQVGNLLLFGRFGIPQEQRVAAEPTDGFRWTYLAATTGHREARRNMAKALQSGLGCSTNLIEAYAWLALLADAGDIVGRVEMNNLALKLDVSQIQEAQELVQQFKNGQWPKRSIQKASKPDLGLKLNGLTPRGQKPLAIINGKTLAEGETVNVKLKNGTVNIKCLKINEDSVLITVEGEDEPRLLNSQ